MKKFMLAVGAAVIASAMVAGGGALADSKYGKGYGKGKGGGGNVLATGFTFCPAGNVAVFPATNVGKDRARVKVSCRNAAGDQFEPLGGGEEGPVRAKLDRGEAVILAAGCAAPDPDPLPLGGELVRCTVSGKGDTLTQMRGVLHICEVEDNVGILGCDLTEAQLFDDDDDDDD